MAPRKVLIIDDDESLTPLLAAMVGSAGWECRSAGSVNEGLDVCAAWQPTIVLLDVNMPGINGLAALRKLKELQYADGSLPTVVMLTGRTDRATVVSALSEGAAGYITKPVTRDDLVAAIEKHYSRH